MAKLFRVTLPEGLSGVKLDSQGRATVQYTAKNVSGVPLDGRAVLVSLPHTAPPSGAVQKGWVKIDGAADRHFEKDREEVITVKIAVPPGSPAGNYIFRLDMVSVARPDEGDSATPVAFNVSASIAPATGGNFKWLLIALVIVLGLAIGGVTTWLILRKPSPPSGAGETAQPPKTGGGGTTQPPPKTGGDEAQASFAGTWVNNDPNTPSLTRLIITQDGNGVSVHAFGKCHPTDCDWGARNGFVAGGVANVTWDQGFVMRTMRLTLDSPGHLRSAMDSVYNDNRPRQHSEEAFHR